MTEQDPFKNMVEAFKKMYDSASNTPRYTIVMSNQYLKELEKSGNFQESTMAKEILMLRDDLREAVKVLRVFRFCIETNEMEWLARRNALLGKYNA